jgi:hypothetical protein
MSAEKRTNVRTGSAATKARRANASITSASEGVTDAPSEKYRIIYADPPWDYGAHAQPDYQTEQRDHYAVMELQAICDMPVKEWIEDDAVLFLWVTSPMGFFYPGVLSADRRRPSPARRPWHYQNLMARAVTSSWPGNDALGGRARGVAAWISGLLALARRRQQFRGLRVAIAAGDAEEHLAQLAMAQRKFDVVGATVFLPRWPRARFARLRSGEAAQFDDPGPDKDRSCQRRHHRAPS